MNRKQLLILIVVGAVLGGLGVVVSKKNSSSWQGTGAAGRKKILGDFPLNDVVQVRLKTATNELNLAVVEDSWRVKERWNHPANFSEISDLIRKFWELKPVRGLKIGASQLGRLGLLDPAKGADSGTLVEFKDKSGKLIRTLLLGKKEMRESQGDSPFGGGGFAVGRYVMVPDSPSQVWLVSESFGELDSKPEAWLSKEFLKVEKPRSVSVTSTNATNSWKLTRETEAGTWALAEAKPGEQADAGKTSGLNYLLSSASFNDIAAPDAKPESIGMDKPILAALETFDGFTYNLKLARKDDDNYFLSVAAAAAIPKERAPGKDEKPEDKTRLDKEFKDKTDKLETKLKSDKAFEKWTYLVSKWTVDALLKERKDLLAEKKEEPKKEDAGADLPKVELPKVELPKVELPKAEPAKPEAPKKPDLKVEPPPLPPLPEKKDPKPAPTLPPAPEKPAPPKP